MYIILFMWILAIDGTPSMREWPQSFVGVPNQCDAEIEGHSLHLPRSLLGLHIQQHPLLINSASLKHRHCLAAGFTSNTLYIEIA